MTTSTRNNHRTYDTDTHKVVPKDAVVLDLKAANSHQGNPVLVLENIIKALRKGTIGCQNVADQIEAQAPKPRITEPGLWGVVEATVGGSSSRGSLCWVRTEEGWYSPKYGLPRWVDLIDPVLIREGV